MDDAQPVRIAVAANEAVALLWRGLLTAEGIPVIVRVAGPGIAYFTPAPCEHYLWKHHLFSPTYDLRTAPSRLYPWWNVLQSIAR